MAIGQIKTNWLHIFEKIYAMAGLMHMLGAMQPVFNSGGSISNNIQTSVMVTDGSLGTQVLGVGIYLIAIILLLPRSRDILTLLSRNKALALFVGLILVSAIWSELPMVTLRRSIALTGTTIFALYLALRFPASEFLTMLALAIGLLAVENLLVVFLLPNLAVHGVKHNFAWAGALGHKNIMGRTMVLGVLVLWAAAPQLRAHKLLVWGAIALCLFLVVMSQSRTSWVAGMALIIAMPFVRYMRRSQIPIVVRFFLVSVVSLGVIVFVVLQYADVGLELIGRDATFTGRTDIWGAAIEVGMNKPMLGSGYRTFYTFGLTNRIRIGNGHNSFLDLWLELGFVGFGIFIATLLVVGRRAMRRLTSSEDRFGIWYPMFLIFMVLYSMAAQVFPDHGTIVWVLYIVITLYLTPLSRETRQSRTFVRRRLDSPVTSPLPAE